MINASLQTLEVNTLTVRDSIHIQDPSVFYPPEPHKFVSPFLEFSGDSNSIVGFRVGNEPFLQYDVSSNCVCAVHLASETVETGILKTDRIECSNATEFAGVLLKEGKAYIPGEACVGGHFIAKTGSVGGVNFREGTIKSLHSSAVSMSVDMFSCAMPIVLLGGVTLSRGCVYANRVELEASSLTTSGDELVFSTGIRTPPNTINELGSIHTQSGHTTIVGNVSVTDRFSANSADIGGIELDHNTLRVWGVGMIGGVTLQDNSISSMEADIGPLRVKEDSVVVRGTIQSFSTQTSDVSAFSIQSLNVTTSRLDASSVETSNLLASTISTTAISTSSISTSSISTTAISAGDYKLSDGSSILNWVYPRGVITLFHGKTPPRGWLECTGRAGTPKLDPPSPDVIYIVRM